MAKDTKQYEMCSKLHPWPELTPEIPPLTDDEYQRLKQSLKDHGQQSPVLIDGALSIIDGHHRVRALKELGHTYVWIERRDLRDEDEKRDLALSMNADRRHMSASTVEQIGQAREQRRARIAELKQAGMSNRAIADELGVDEKTVRKDVRKTGADVSAPEKVTGKDGKQYTASRPAPQATWQDTWDTVRRLNPGCPVALQTTYAGPSLFFGPDAKEIAALLGVQPVYLPQGLLALKLDLHKSSEWKKGLVAALKAQGRQIESRVIVKDHQLVEIQNSFGRANPIESPVVHPTPIPQLKSDAELRFPVQLDKTEISSADIRIMRINAWLEGGQRERRYDISLNALGRSGKQQNSFGVTASLLAEEQQVKIKTHGSVHSIISLSQWQAFVDQLPVVVSTTSITTIKHTPLLAQMCRDVIAFRRKEPSEAEWLAEEAAARSSATVEQPAEVPADTIVGPAYDALSIADELMAEITPNLGIELETAQIVLLEMLDVKMDVEGFCLTLKLFSERYAYHRAVGKRMEAESEAEMISSDGHGYLDRCFQNKGYKIIQPGRSGKEKRIARYLERAEADGTITRFSVAYYVDGKAHISGKTYVEVDPVTREPVMQADVLALLIKETKALYLVKMEDLRGMLTERGGFMRVIENGHRHGVLIPLEQIARFAKVEEMSA